MEHKISSPCRRILALVLCFAMLLPMLPTRVFAADETIYHKGEVVFGGDGFILEDEIVAANAGITTSDSTKQFKYVRVDSLVHNDRYVFMSDKYEVIMSYSAVCENGTTKNQPGNIIYASDGHSLKTYYYMNANEDVLYMGHSQRDAALWILDGMNKDALGETAALFGGTGGYSYAQFIKGRGPTFDSDGNITQMRNGAYWYSVNGQDTAKTQYRFLNHRYVNQNTLAFLQYADVPDFQAIQNETTDYTDRYCVEVFDDDTFLIYYRNEHSNIIRVFCYDGIKWGVKEYETMYGGDTGMTKEAAAAATAEAVKADLAGLKLRLYRYGSDDGMLSLSATGYTTYRVPAGTSKAQVVEIIEKNGKLNVFDVNRNHIPVPYDNTNKPTAKIGYYWLDTTGYSAKSDYTINVMYSQDDGTDVKVLELNVEYEDFDYSGLSKLGVVAVGAGVGAKVQQIDENGNPSDMTFALTEDGKTINVPITVGMLTYTADDEKGHKAGNIVDTSTATNMSPITGLTLTYDGMIICDDFMLNVGFADSIKEYAWGNPGSVLADKEGTTTEVDFSNSGVANIELSASSIPIEKGVDLILVIDLSGSMRNAVDGNDMLFDAAEKEEALKDPKWKETRVYVMEQALRSMLQTLTDNNADVRIAISDFGDIGAYEFDGAVLEDSIRDTFYFTGSLDNVQNNSYEFYNHLNFVINDYDYKYDELILPGFANKAEAGPYGISDRKTNKAHPLYTGKITPTVYTGDGSVNYSAFEKVSDLYARFDDVVDVINENAFLDYGTNYDVGLEYAYQLGHAVQEKNIAAGEDRQTVCIFLSDGAAMQYNYFSGSTITSAWKNWLSGDADDLLKNGTLAMSIDSVQNLNEISKGMLDALMKNNKGNSTLQNWAYNRGNNTKADDGVYYLNYRPDLDSGAKDFYTLMAEQSHDLDWDYLCQLAKANGIENFTLEMYQSDVTMAKLRDLLIVDETERATAQKNMVAATDTTPADQQKDGYLIDENGEFIYNYVSKLIDPSRQVKQYYPVYTGTPDTSKSYYEQFVDAYAAVTGQECTSDIFTRLAYKNRATYADTTALGTAMLSELVASLKKPTEGKDHQTYSPYFYFYNADGKHWMAEAMKGDTDKLYPVINKYAKEDNHEAVFNYYGDVRNKFDTGTGLDLDGEDYISGFRGLGMELYTVMFSVSDANLLSTDVASQVMENIASGRNYDYNANDLAELNKAFQRIISSMMIGATQAWYTDTMGNEYDLYTGKDLDNDGQDDLMEKGDEPKIQVLQYSMDNKHQPTDDYMVLETITFNWTTGWRQRIDENGNYYVEEYTLKTPLKAVSDQIMTSENLLVTVTGANGKKTEQTVIVHNYVDIWGADGVIAGEYVSYNTNSDRSVYISFGGQGSYSLAPETFFWTIGVMGHAKFVLEYDVILEGILDGTRELNSSKKYYDTNESARLTYTNYLGITRYQEPGSPRYPWGADTEIVVDYGLPVYIDVPNYGKGFTLEYVGYLGTGDAPEHGPLAEGFAASAEGQFGKLEVVGNQVKYTFEAKNMSMNTTERFAMALLAEEFENGEVVKNYYYVPVTVVPATTIYYEDNFLNYGAFDENGNPTTDIFWETIVDEEEDVGGDTGDDTEPEANYYVAGSSELCGSNWLENDANNIMTKGEDGRYFKVYENVAPGTYELKVTDGTWTNSWGGNDGNYIFTVESTDNVTVYFDASSMKVSVVIGIETETYIVAGSGELCGNAWDPADVRNIMKKGEDGRYFKVYENVAPGSYELKVTDGSWNNSWGVGSNNYTFTVNETNTVTVYFNPETTVVNVVVGTEESGGTTTDPDDTVTEKDYYVTGDADWLGGNWGLNGTPDLMTERVNGIYTKVYQNVPSGGYALKVKVGAGVGDADWGESWGNGANPYSFNVLSTGTVIVIFDSINGNICVEVEENRNSAPEILGDYVKQDYYVVGTDDSFLGGWNNNFSGKMTDNGVGLYSKVYHDVPAGEYALKVNLGHWDHPGWGNNNENVQLNVVDTATVIVYFNAVTETVYYEIVYASGASANYYVVGTDNSFLGGWNNNLSGLMTNDGTGRYSKVYENVPAGSYELKVNMGNWDLGSWGNGTGADNNYRLNVSSTSTVTVYFEPASGDINVYVVQKDDEKVVQDTDRPGTDNLMEGLKDAENIYGFDNAYTSMTTHSLNEAMKVTLKPGYYATATFSFWGTGFDVVSLTSRDTGTILVAVHEKDAFDKDGTKAPVVKYAMVDTYYGYKQDADGKWVVDNSVEDSLYQVPVIKIKDLEYGNYTVVITAQYAGFFDHFEPDSVNGSYDFYLDAIRIYDPANDGADNETIKDAYVADGEGWPEYVELRDVLIDSKTFDGLTQIMNPAAVFIDGKNGSYNVQDYMNYGPNNELYLANGQMVMFMLNIPDNVAKVQVGLKTHEGSTKAIVGGKVLNISSTDMYYDLTDDDGRFINIMNNGTEVLSITNIKVTYKTAPVEAAGYRLFSVNRGSVESMLNELNASFKDDSFILAGANTVLGGVLDMNFFIDPADLNGTDYYAEIKLYAEDGVVTTTVPYADWEVRADYLVVTQKGLAARQMADKIEVVIYNGDGTQASEVWTDSIRDYAMRMLEKQDEEGKALLVDMLNYGAAAQSYFNYNTADLANSQLTDAQKAYATESVSGNDQSVAGEGYYGSSLTLKDRILMTVYFEGINPDMYAIVSFTDHKGVAHETRVDGTSFSKKDGTICGVVVDELVVADGDQLVTVTVYDAEGNVVTSATDSVNSYAARMMGENALYEMVAKFTASAYAYFH